MKLRVCWRRILSGSIAMALVLGLPVAAAAGSVSLTWDSNTEPDLAGYKVHVGIASEAYSQTVDVGNVTSATVSELSEGETYFFTITAYDIFANESDFSNEVSETIAAAPEPTPEPEPGAEPEPTCNKGKSCDKAKRWGGEKVKGKKN